MAHGLDQATNRIDRALPDYIHKLQVDGRDRTYHAVIAELIKYVVGAARPIPGIQMIYGIIIKLLDQGGSIVYEKEICRATAKRSSSGTGIGRNCRSTEHIASAGKAESAHHFGDLMCRDTLKIKCASGDLTGESKRILRTEGGASVIGHIIWNKAKRLGLRSRQRPGSEAVGGIVSGHAPPDRWRWHRFAWTRTR